MVQEQLGIQPGWNSLSAFQALDVHWIEMKDEKLFIEKANMCRVHLLLLLLSSGWASSLELLDAEPGLKCSCDLANVISFTAVHARNTSGQWNTEITVERGACSIDRLADRSVALITAEKAKPSADGYELFPAVGSYYKHHTVSRTWEEARYVCEQEGAHLAIINSEEEANILSDIFKRSPKIPNVQWDFAFIGYHDLYDEGNYLTIFGEPLASLGFGRIWKAGEINNLWQNDVNSGEDCGSVHRNGGLNDLFCEIRHSFFCEKELGLYPPPGSVDNSASAFRSLQDEKKPPKGTKPRKHPGPGYELFKDVGYYKFHTTGTTWENARRICHEEGGHLAIINSQIEGMVLTALFKGVPNLQMTNNSNLALVGFHDLYVEGDHRTIYGEPLKHQGYAKWAPGAPDNYGQSNLDPGQDCGSVTRTGELDDIDCHNHYAFFCEQKLLV
ncbi:uncharacterized protein [Anabrus simplex]|uniref:uncharacterized protein n=1 Tax=Anabrus simplex TaxID=316456 RepID=UPI0035A2CFAB